MRGAGEWERCLFSPGGEKSLISVQQSTGSKAMEVDSRRLGRNLLYFISLFSASGSQLCHSTGPAKALFMARSFKGFLSSLVGCWKPNRAQTGGNGGKKVETEGEGQSWQRGDLGRGLLQCGDFIRAVHSSGRGKKRKEWNSRE